jgi:hypothetical protein
MRENLRNKLLMQIGGYGFGVSAASGSVRRRLSRHWHPCVGVNLLDRRVRGRILEIANVAVVRDGRIVGGTK